MYKREMKILQETVKKNARDKSIMLAKDHPDTEETPVKLEDVTVFATELCLKKSSFTCQNEGMGKGWPQVASFHNDRSLKSVTVELPHADSIASH